MATRINAIAPAKTNPPAIPANFAFTVLNDIKLTGMTAKAAVSVHPQLLAKCENREERIEQVQAALNEAFAGVTKKIELSIKESGDVKMRSVNLAGSASSTILPSDTTFYVYVDARTGRINVMPNLSQQWAELKREFAANGMTEYAYISPFAAGIVETTEEPEDEENEERESVESMDSRNAMIAALEAKLAALEKANSDLAHQVLDVEDKNKELMAQVEAAEKANAELAVRVEVAEKENVELRNGYMELIAMIEKIERNANVEESKTVEQNEVVESTTNNDPIATMDKHADAIAADMGNIASRANNAKKAMESIAEKATNVQNETSQMVDKINAMQTNKPDVGALRARLSAHLAAPLEVEETNSGDCP